MGGDDDRALPVRQPPQEFGLVDAELIAVQSENQGVAGVGVEFGPRYYQEVVPPLQGADLVPAPEGIVVGEADPVQAQRLASFNEGVHVHEAVVGLGVGVGVKVDQQVAPGRLCVSEIIGR